MEINFTCHVIYAFNMYDSMQWFLVYSQCCTTLTIINFRMSSSFREEALYLLAVSSYPSIVPTLALGNHPFAYCLYRFDYSDILYKHHVVLNDTAHVILNDSSKESSLNARFKNASLNICLNTGEKSTGVRVGLF